MKWTIEINPSRPLRGIFPGAASGQTYVERKKILITPGKHMEQTLAHEVAHAIEIIVKKRTSEYTAWKIAKSFLKPKYWSQEFADHCYATYVDAGEHLLSYYIKKASTRWPNISSELVQYPEELPRDKAVKELPKEEEEEGTWKQMSFIF